MAPTQDNGLILGGFSMSTDGDVTENHGGTDYWIVKLGSCAPPVISVSGNDLCTTAFSSYQWVFNDTAIAGATDQCYTPLQNGYYSVITTDSSGCTAPANPMIFISASFEQLICTDIDPDVTLNTDGDTYNLDLNNDGTVDFFIAYASSPSFNGPCTGSHTNSNVEISPAAGNAVVIDSVYPGELNEGAPIASGSPNNDDVNQVLASDAWHCAVIIFPPHHYWSEAKSGNWVTGATDKYLGFKLKVGAQDFYGWLRLSMGANASYATIKDYAYSSVANSPLYAGDTCSIAVGISVIHHQEIISCYPNPFSPDQSGSTIISFFLSQLENVSLKIFDVEGRLIRTLADELMSEGSHTLRWDARDENENAVSAGIYFLRIQSPDFSKTLSLSLIK